MSHYRAIAFTKMWKTSYFAKEALFSSTAVNAQKIWRFNVVISILNYQLKMKKVLRSILSGVIDHQDKKTNMKTHYHQIPILAHFAFALAHCATLFLMNFTKTVKLTKTPITCHYRGWNSFSCDHFKKSRKLLESGFPDQCFWSCMLDCRNTFWTVFIAQTCMYCNACKAVYKHEIFGQTFSRKLDYQHVHCNRKLPNNAFNVTLMNSHCLTKTSKQCFYRMDV